MKFIMLCFLIGTLSCSSNGSSTDNSVEAQSPGLNQKFLIGDDSVNGLVFGDDIYKDRTLDGVNLVKATETFSSGRKTDYYAYVKDGIEEITVYPLYDFRVESYTSMIGQISIKSDKYQDAKGIHVGSTVSDVLKEYPSAYMYYDLANDEIIMSNEGHGPQYVVDVSKLKKVETVNIGKIDQDQVKASAKIQEIRIVRSTLANESSKINKEMEGQNILENYLKTLIGSYSLEGMSENYYKIHFLQGEYFVSECFEDECNNKGKIISALLQQNGMVALNLENISGEMVPSWTINPSSSGKLQLYVHDYDAEQDIWTDRIFTKSKYE